MKRLALHLPLFLLRSVSGDFRSTPPSPVILIQRKDDSTNTSKLSESKGRRCSSTSAPQGAAEHKPGERGGLLS